MKLLDILFYSVIDKFLTCILFKLVLSLWLTQIDENIFLKHE